MRAVECMDSTLRGEYEGVIGDSALVLPVRWYFLP